VEEADSGFPATVSTTSLNSSGRKPPVIKTARKQVIAAIDDCWRIDDEWWRSQPVSRLYYTVRLKSGQKLVIYKDLNNGNWYRQMY